MRNFIKIDMSIILCLYMVLLGCSALQANDITVVIPVKSSSVEYLPELLQSLEDQSVMPNKTILMCGNLSAHDKRLVMTARKQFEKLRIRVFYSRNAEQILQIKKDSLRLISTTYVSFIEPECRVDPLYIESVRRAFNETNLDCVLARWIPSNFEDYKRIYREFDVVKSMPYCFHCDVISKVSELSDYPQIRFGSQSFRSKMIKKLNISSGWEMISNWQINDMNLIVSYLQKKEVAVITEPLFEIDEHILLDHY